MKTIFSRHLTHLALLTASPTAMLAFGAAQAQAQVRQFDIPTQALSSAILEFSRQSDVLVAVVPAVTAGKRSQPVKGAMPVNVAIARLLRGSGLVATPNPQGGYRIMGARGESQARREDLSAVAAPRAAAIVSAPASVQVAQPSDAAVVAEAPEPDIVVTAQRREQKLQDVPLSIAVVTGEEIAARGLVNSEDYLRGIPGVSQTEGFPGQTVTIRGLETTRDLQNYGSGTTVATYFGETPTTNSAGLGGGSNVDLKVVDVARVEVLRGPQGTSFGDSSMGGAVRTIPMAPRLDAVEGRVMAGYSATGRAGGDNYTAQATLNLPVATDRIAVRAVAYVDDDSGYYRNRAASDANFVAKAVTPYGAQAYLSNQDQVGGHRSYGGRIAALFAPADDLRLTLTYVRQRTELDGVPISNSGEYQQSTLEVAPEHRIRGRAHGASDTDINLFNALLNYKLGNIDLLATYSYIRGRSRQAYPYTYVNSLFPASYLADSHHREHIGELRAVTNFDGPLNFIAGVYLQRARDRETNDYLWYGDPATNFFNGGKGQRFLGAFFDRRRLTQKAAYGEATLRIVPRLTLTGGVRAYRYDRTFKYDANGTPFFGAAGIHTTANTDASGVTGRANLSYKIGDDALVYAAWSQGFRLGQLQRGVPPGTCDVNNDGVVDGTSITLESTRRVNSDRVQNYEVGSKFALLNRRVTGAVTLFRMNWSDMPVRAVVPCSGITQSYVTNAGESRAQGVEFQVAARIARALRIDAGASFVDAKLTRAIPALAVPAGNRLPSPRFNGSAGIEYAIPTGRSKVVLRADTTYVGPFYGSITQAANTRAGDYVKLDLSARAGLGPVELTLFVDNLTNEDAYTYRGATNMGIFFGSQLQPRTIGFRAGYSF